MVTAPLPSMFGRAGLEAEHVVLAEPQLGGVLDGDDPLVIGDEGREHVERRGLPGTRTAGDEDVEAAADAPFEEPGRGLGQGPEVDQVVDRVGVLGELADGQLGAVERERRDDRVDAAAVGQAGVHHRARLVDASADLADDLVDRAAQVGLVGERGARLDQLAAPLDVDGVERVDHDLGEARVAQQGLDRAVAEDVVRDLLRDARAVGRRHRGVGVGDGRLERQPDLLLELGLRHVGVVQLRAERLDQSLVHRALEVLEGVGLGAGALLVLGVGHAALHGRGRRPGGSGRTLVGFGRTAACGGEAVGEAHVMPSSGGVGSRWASGSMGCSRWQSPARRCWWPRSWRTRRGPWSWGGWDRR